MQPVERAEYEGVDYAWVMQTTFVVTILVGAPVVAVLSTLVTLESWGARAAFAVRVGAPIWFVTAVTVALYARRTEAGDGGGESGDDGDGPDDTDEDDARDETGDAAAADELDDARDADDPAADAPPGDAPTEAEKGD
ncbi:MULTISPECIES: DUF5822 domain-containing protein [Halorubrum]|uniref:Peptidoglycan-binding protein n=1 Tax=Halorubrum hochstenium ATCC 700873 TaxID=1227481 RepID=M0F5F3_9EURY|nr:MULTISPECIES: DUF5822 domain-containing protein [Halorubrum]ELZ55165.1 hypothetical protein C467_10576 [Halorubrum hochstenium ATCC 700873]